MNRKQVLRRLIESFSEEEIQAIQDSEAYTRNAIAKIVNDLNGEEIIRSDTDFSDAISQYARDIADTIFIQDNKSIREKEADRESKIYQAAKDEIADILRSSKYAKNAETISSTIRSLRLETDNLLEDSFSLNSLVGDPKIGSFLLDLYDVSLHFGGGNTIGKGELMLAAILSDVKLITRAQSGSRSGLVSVETGLPIELKRDNGRLDGSGIEPKRFEVRELISVIENALGDLCGIYSIKKLCLDMKRQGRRDAAGLFARMQEALKDNNYVVNPFSRRSIQGLWFTDVPNWLNEIAESCALLGTKVNVNLLLQDTLVGIYSKIYSTEVIESSVESEFVLQSCEGLASICLEVKDIEEFILMDTTIRARIYMRLSRRSQTEKAGYLVFIKPANGSIILHCIDYTAAGNDKAQWSTKVRGGALRIKPGNDDRRASHQVQIK